MSKTTIYKDEDLSVIAELREEGILFLHSYVYRYSKSVSKKAKALFQAIKKELYLNGFDEVFSYTPNPKFAKLMDDSCEVLEIISGPDGKEYEVLVWDLK